MHRILAAQAKKNMSVLRISPYSVRMRENRSQKNSKYGHFSRSLNNMNFQTIDMVLIKAKCSLAEEI